MNLEFADWQALLPVFRETYKIWSPGLSRSDYLEYQSKQENHPWARRNLRHLTLNKGGKIVSSLKLSNLDLQVRGKTFKVGGLGAVYTQQSCRNLGYASKLIEETIDLARQENFQGLILFSDIDCGFYSRYGFEEIGAADLLINLPFVKGKAEFPSHINAEDEEVTKISIDGNNFELRKERYLPGHLDYVQRHYGQWLRSKAYGIERNKAFFDYKLMREMYLHGHSRLSWPALFIVIATQNGRQAGYALAETAGGVLRIMEIAGPPECREAIWMALLVRALREKLQRIRAWEGLAADFAPSFSLKQLIKRAGLEAIFPAEYKGQLNYYNRSWGKGMLLPIDDKLKDLNLTAPCPLTEIDHL